MLKESELNQKIEEITKDQLAKRANQTKPMTYAHGMAEMVNMSSNADRKVDSAVPFSFLRRASVAYPIARACINRRIRQMTQLEWDVTTIEEIEDEEGYSGQIKMVKDWLKRPFGAT